MKLPFLYAHGPLVWKVLLLLLAAGSWLALARTYRWLASRRARSLHRWAKGRARPIEVGWGVVRGRIVSGFAETTEGLEWRRARRSDELLVDVDGERIPILGDVRVVLGASRHQSAETGRVVRRVAEGDEVYIAATAARQDDGGWTLSHPPRLFDAFVELTASDYAAPNGRLAASWAISWVFMFTAGWAAVLYGIGQRAISNATSHHGGLAAIASFDALAIAAAMPGSHDRSLDLLETHLERDFEQTEEALQLWVELAERDGCATGRLFAMQRYEDAVAAARRCGSRGDEALALLYLGRYDEAAAVAPEGSDTAAMALIARRRWDEAARQVERNGPSCFSAYLRSLSGDDSTFEHVVGNDMLCRLLRAAALPPDAAAERFLELRLAKGDEWFGLRQALLEVVTAPEPDAYVATGDLGAWPEPTVWFADQRIARAQGTSRSALRELYRQRMQLALYRGDLHAARVELGIATALTPQDPPEGEMADLWLLDSSLPKPPHLRTHVEIGDLRETGEIDHDLTLSCNDGSVAPAFAAAVRGDGAALADVARRCELDASAWGTLVAVGPLIKSRRKELAAALRFFRDRASGTGPFEAIQLAFRTRELSRAYGDHEEVARNQAIIDRHYAALSDPQVALALHLSRGRF